MTEIIPAIDIINGQCVRLTKGDYSTKKTYSNDPVSIAKQYNDLGFKRLHVVDLDGAKSKTIVNYKTLENIAKETDLVIDFGGGIKKESDLIKAFDCGASMVTAGSIAATDKETVSSWLSKFGPEKIIIGADVLDGKVKISGWQEDGGITLDELVSYYMKAGAGKFICTDISRDGNFTGPSMELYRKTMDKFSGIELIASGGVSNLSDVRDVIKQNMAGVIIGKAIYEEKIDLKELAELI